LEKLSCQEELKGQLLKVSDLESRLDQLRFEPSPNAVTLNGSKARIKTLTEELEEAQGQIQLRNIEVSLIIVINSVRLFLKSVNLFLLVGAFEGEIGSE